MYTARQFQEALDAFEAERGGREAIANMSVRTTINGELVYANVWPEVCGEHGVIIGGQRFLTSTWEDYYLHLKLTRQVFGECTVPWGMLREVEKKAWASGPDQRKDREKVLDNNPVWVSYVEETGWQQEKKAQLDDLFITEEDGRAMFNFTYVRPKGSNIYRSAPYPWG